ncbi:hypothetical protein GCM10009597_49990 [Peribacillus frigoritolerans]
MSNCDDSFKDSIQITANLLDIKTFCWLSLKGIILYQSVYYTVEYKKGDVSNGKGKDEG